MHLLSPSAWTDLQQTIGLDVSTAYSQNVPFSTDSKHRVT